MSEHNRNIKVFCIGTERSPHRERQVALLSFWTDESGCRFLQDRTKIPDGSKRAEVLRVTGERVRRQVPVGEEGGLMYRAPDGREHVVQPPTPSGRTGAIAETASLTWCFTCPLCQKVNPQLNHQMSNQRVFKAAFAAVAAREFRPTLPEFDRFGRTAG